MMDADKRDAAVAYIEADSDRLAIIRVFEKKSEPLTLEYLDSRFPILPKQEISKILHDLGEKDVIQKLSEDPSTWDFTMFGHQILYALEVPARIHKFSLFHMLRTLFYSIQKSPESKPE